MQKEKERGTWVLFPIAIYDAVYEEDSEIARTLSCHVIEDFREGMTLGHTRRHWRSW